MFSGSIPLVVALLSYFEPPNFTTHRSKRDLVKPLQFTELFQTLSYGDNCSHVAEEMRENFVKSVLVEGLDESALFEKKDEFLSDIIKTGLPLCSAEKMVICDKISAECVCGESARSALLGANHPSGHASKFAVDMETGSCRWEEGTSCVSKEDNPTGTDFCSSPTHCANIKTGNPCQPSDHVNEYISRGAHDGLKATFSGEICTCQTDDKPKVPYEQESESKFESNSEQGNSRADCINRGVAGVAVTVFATLAVLTLM